MIRWAEQADVEAVVSLWTRCFPGDEAFREWFFANIYRSDVTLVDEEDGKLCAMVQMLPYQLRDARGVRPVTYIYGACTAPEYRRQHRMDRLLQASFDWDQKHGRAASILIPQEEWLYGFYDQFGYRPAFYVSNQIVTNTNEPVAGHLRRLNASDIPALDWLYTQTQGMRLLRTEQDWKQQLALFDALGAGVYGLEQQDALTTYAFVWHDDAGKLWAQEICGTEQNALAQAVLQQLHCQTMRLTLEGNEQKLGCIRYHEDTPVQDGYFNLLFN
ncbi:GNAT family N-acetyltransferase [Butyricicoccus sp.]|uniref:GNAT family N-acetyltransferase n=1 Tax=Butyricicoccus sp. TaxID=2049021 RepID=UPI003D7C7FD9